MKQFDRLTGIIILSCLYLFTAACKYEAPKTSTIVKKEATATDIVVGAQRIATYYPALRGKRVGLVVNQTSMVDDMHLVDTLLTMRVDVKAIFAPEHGFRGKADAGEHVDNGKDAKTGLPIISLYGKNKKPSPEQLQNLDVIVFDIQDVGARFYTYISTLHYVMEASAEANIPVIVLDRPNPNGHYVDGPILEKEFKSFVGMHPVPVVYGMTIGEYAKMINGENWLKNDVQADLTVIACKNYTHDTFYELPIKPSPNLPNIKSILLYPSLCFFEGTTVSVGRGTDTQFQVYGHPNGEGTYQFTPTPNEGAKYPKHNGELCHGVSLTSNTLGSIYDAKKLDLSHLISMYEKLKSTNTAFFNDNNFFEKLAGTAQLRTQIQNGLSEEEIRMSWDYGLKQFETIRARYLMYE